MTVPPSTDHFLRTVHKVLLDMLHDERIDPARWAGSLDSPAYASLLAGTLIDYAVCTIKALSDSEQCSFQAFELMSYSLHHRIDLAVMHAFRELHTPGKGGSAGDAPSLYTQED